MIHYVIMHPKYQSYIRTKQIKLVYEHSFLQKAYQTMIPPCKIHIKLQHYIICEQFVNQTTLECSCNEEKKKRLDVFMYVLQLFYHTVLTNKKTPLALKMKELLNLNTDF